MDNTTTLISNEVDERAQMIMSESFAQPRWRRPASISLAMINQSRSLDLRVDRDHNASCLQGATSAVQTKQNKGFSGSSIVMGGHYDADGTFPNRWGTRPGSPPV